MNRYRAYIEAEIDDFIAFSLAADPKSIMQASVMYDAYMQWSETHGRREIPPMSKTLFGRMTKKRLLWKRMYTGNFYLGVRLVQSVEPQMM